MGITSDVNFLAVIDALVLIAASIKPVVGSEFIGKNDGFWQDMFFDESAQCVLLNVCGDKGSHVAFALSQADDGSFIVRASDIAFVLAAEIGFVNFDFAIPAAHWSRVVVREHGADLFEHPPCRFVSDASFALNLFCGDSATGLSH